MIWNEPKETMSRDEMYVVQSARLRNIVNESIITYPFIVKRCRN